MTDGNLLAYLMPAIGLAMGLAAYVIHGLLMPKDLRKAPAPPGRDRG
jgi:hypothetical protein